MKNKLIQKNELAKFLTGGSLSLCFLLNKIIR